jgi:hypothetical protein
VGAVNGKLYAIYNDSGDLAKSPWPMFHHDVRHTGNRRVPFSPSLIFLLMGY